MVSLHIHTCFLGPSFPRGPGENRLGREAQQLPFSDHMNVPVSSDTNSQKFSKVCKKGRKVTSFAVSQQVEEIMIQIGNKCWQCGGHCLLYGGQRENKETMRRTHFRLRNGPRGALSIRCPRPTAALVLPSSAPHNLELYWVTWINTFGTLLLI